jgi:hypothetical protein
MATKNAASSAAAKKTPSKKSVKLTKAGKDPKGGLTAAGRKAYNQATGGHLRPGVKGAADTPEKKRRKGSFLTRHFTTPPGPVEKNGEPTPKSEADEKKLAAKGRKLLSESKEG